MAIRSAASSLANGERDKLLLRSISDDIGWPRCSSIASSNQLGTRKLLRSHGCELSTGMEHAVRGRAVTLQFAFKRVTPYDSMAMA